MPRRKAISLRNIKAWARRQAPTDTVGRRCDGSGCPVARYAEQEVGLDTPSVGHTYYSYYADRVGRVERDMPDSVGRLVRLVDQVNGPYFITAAQLLEMIELVEMETP